jgi:2-oxo-4-hydroxy-4-carboxy-5-ureidoimidazoline decarboxylase
MSGNTAAYLNALPDAAARAALGRCCAARRWVDGMLAARPFASDDTLHASAERVWWGLERADWLEAFAAHARIGERAKEDWSRREQAGLDGAGEATRAALADGNSTYERRFGHVFLICATGKTAAEILDALRVRLTNARATELRIAAEEHAKITRLRLENLVVT